MSLRDTILNWRNEMIIQKKTKRVSDMDRVDILRMLTGRPYDYCDLCGSRVSEANLASWDQDGHVYCDQHGRGVVKFKTGESYHD